MIEDILRIPPSQAGAGEPSCAGKQAVGNSGVILNKVLFTKSKAWQGSKTYK